MSHENGRVETGLESKPSNKEGRLDGQDLKELGARLDHAREEMKAKTVEPETKRAGAMGVAFRLSTEMVLALVIGGGIGWFIDDWLGTIPLFFLIFFVVGMAAGVKNVIRAANELNRENDTVAEPGSPASTDRSDRK